jgi:hypothetical protein
MCMKRPYTNYTPRSTSVLFKVSVRFPFQLAATNPAGVRSIQASTISDRGGGMGRIRYGNYSHAD